MANKKITIGLDFDVNLAELERIKDQLDDIRLPAVTQKNISAELKEAGEAAKILKDALEDAWNPKLGQLDLSKLNKSIKDTYGNIGNFRKAISGAGTIGTNVFDNFSKTVLKTNVQIKQTNKLLDSMATSMANTIKWGLTSSVFNNITGSLQKAWDYSLKLDSSLNDIRIVTGKSADEMERFARVANTSAKDLRASTLDYTEAALIYYQQGLGEADVKARTETTLKVANVTGQTGQAVSEQLTAVWNGYKVAAEESELYIDKLSAVAATTAADLEELSTGMSKVASAANAMGVDVDQLNAQLATIISVTKAAPESVGTALKTIYARMGDIEAGVEEDGVTLGDYTEKMAEMGVNVLNAKGELRDMGEVIEEVGNNWSNLSREQQIALAQTMAGTRQYNNLIALFDSWEMYEDALNSSKNSAGELQKQQDIYMESTEAYLQRLATEAENTYDILFDDTAVKTMTSSLTGLLSVFNSLLTGTGGGLSALTFLGANVTTLLSGKIGKGISQTINNRRSENQEKSRKSFIDDIYASAKNSVGERVSSNLGQKVENTLDKSFINVFGLYSNMQDQLTEDEQAQTYEIVKRITVRKEELKLLDKYTSIMTAMDSKYSGKDNKESFEEKLQKYDDVDSYIKNFVSNYNKQLKKEMKSLVPSGKKISYADSIRFSESTNFMKQMRKLGIGQQFNQDQLKYIATLFKEGGTLKKKDFDFIIDLAKNNKEFLREVYEEFNGHSNDMMQLRKKVAEEKVEDSSYLTGLYLDKMETKQISAAVSGLSSLTVALTGVSGILKTINNDALSTKEAFLQIAVTSLATLPHIINFLKNLKDISQLSNTLLISFAEDSKNFSLKNFEASEKLGKTIKSLLQSEITFGKNAGKAMNAVGDGAAAAGIKVGALLGWIALVTAAIAVLGYAWYKAEVATEEAAEAAKRQVQSLKENFDELNQKAEELNNTISSYQDSIKSLEELDKTTQDYKNTLTETNNKAKELIESLKLYGQFTIDPNTGAIVINPNALKEAQEKAEQDKNAAQDALNYGQLVENTNQLRLDFENTWERVYKDLPAGLVSNTNTAYKFQEKDFKYVLDELLALKTGTEEEQIKYNKIISSDAGFKEYILDYFPEATTEEDAKVLEYAVNALSKKRTDFQSYVEKSEAISKENDYYIQQINTQAIENRYKEELELLAKKEDGTVDIALYEQLKNIVNNSQAQQQAQNSTLNIVEDNAFSDPTDWSDNWGEGIFTFGNNVQEKQMERLLSEYYNTSMKEQFGRDIQNKKDLAIAYAENIKNIQNAEDLDWEGNQLKDGDTIVVDLSSAEKQAEAWSNLWNLTVSKIITEDNQNAYQAATNNLIDSLGKVLETAGPNGNKYGVDFRQGILGAISDPEHKFDFSYLFKSLNPDEIQEIRKMSPEDILKLLDITEEEAKAAGLILGENFIAGFDNYSYSISDEIEAAMAEKEKEFEKIGEDLSKTKLKEYQEEVQAYAKNLMQAAKKEGSKLGEVLKHDAKLAVDFALKVVKMNKAIETLADNFKDWNSILKQSSETSAEYALAIDGLRMALADIYDVSGDNISNDFIIKNLSEIEKVAKGDETAIEGLRFSLAEDLIFNIGINNGLTQTEANAQVQKFTSLKDRIQKALDESPTMGLDIDSSTFIDDLNEIMTTSKMTVGEANELFSSLGIEPIYATDEVEQTQYNPIIETSTAVSDVGWREFEDGQRRLAVTTVQTSKEIGKEPFTSKVPITAISYDGTQPKITGFKRAPGGSYNNYSSSNRGGGSPGKNGGSKSTSKKKDKIKDSVDRYHDVNIELKKVANQLKNIQDETEKLAGADLIDNLTQQYKLLNEEIALTDKKIALVNEELYGTDTEIGLKQKLKNQNVEFDEETGMISNYAEIVQEKEDYVNSLIEKYKAMSAEEQEEFEETLQKAEDDFREFLEDIKRYDELTTEELEALEEDKKEKLNKIIENNIQQFNLEIELRLEMTQAERDWNEFKKKVIDDIKEDDILGNAQARLKDFHSFYQENAAEGSIQQLTRHINDIFFDIKQMEQGVESNIYGKNIKQAKEHLQEYSEQLREELETIKDYTDEIRQSYLDMMDEAKGEFDKQIEQYEQIADLIDHDLKLLELLSGEKNYKSFSHYYNMQVKNNKEQLDFQRQEMEFWKAEMENAEEGSEKWLKAKENLETTTIAWRELTNKSIEDVQAKYLNAIKLIFEELNNEITSGKGLEYIKEEWDLITRNSEKYLDNINAAYGIEQLRNKYQEAIDNTDSISAQEQLNDLMAKEIAVLEEKDKLTEYDVERANKRYEIALKQIALEEAQQNKTSMRLKRDSQGNYSYVFTADEDAVSKAEDELANAQNALYNFDKENYLNNLDELYAAYEEYQEKMFEAAQINDPEERAQKELLINEQYGELINGLTEQNQNIRNNLYESAFEELARLQDKNTESFKNMTQTQKDALMNDLIPQWESGVQQMADKFAGEGGLEEVCKGAMEQISETTQQYKTDLEEVEETSGLAFDKIEQGTDKAIEYTKDLITENDALIKTYENLLLAVQAVIKEWETLLELEKDSTKYAEETLEDTHKYLQTNLGDDDADKYSDNKDYSKGITDVAIAIAGGDGSRATRNYLQQLLDERQEKEDRNPGITSVTTDRLEKLVNAFLDFKNPKHEKAVELVNLVDQGLANYTDEILSSYGFRTGGYTGNWSGDEGRLALLHQKELVLNANDTQNILNAVQIIRSVEGSLLRRMSEMTSNIGNVYSIAENKETLEQNVHIEANFPNVTNSKEVENAIDNLINIAAQRTHRDIK